MADLPSNLTPSNNTIQLVITAIAGGGFFKVIGVLMNKALDRKMKHDEFIAKDGADFIQYMQLRMKEMGEEIDTLEKRLEDKTLQETGLKIQVRELEFKIGLLENENKLLTTANESLRRDNEVLRQSIV